MNYIIHFTEKLEIVNNILDSSSLRLTYCSEDFQLGAKKVSSAAHPMVCFGEYDINQLENQTITYGKYGIAFTEIWARKNKLHPVLYLDKNSVVAKSLADLLRARRNKEDSKLPDNLRLSIMTIKCFTKNIIGYNSYLKKINFNFRNEHEWRFVPKKNEIANGLISQSKSKFLAKKEYYNKKLLPFPLKFKHSDIEYIFVEKKSEIKLIAKKYSIQERKIKVSNWNV